MDSKIQLIDSLLQEVTKFKMTDDSAFMLAREWLSDKIDSYRATVLKKAVSEKKNVNNAYQIVTCLQPECMGVNCVVQGIEIVSPANIWKVEIPELLDIEKSIKYFGLTNLQHQYSEVDLFAMSANKERWGRALRKFTRIGRELYYHNFDETRLFTLIGIFATPMGICDYQNTDPYPLGKEYQEQLLLLLKRDLYQMLGIPIDETDDTKDNIGAVKVKPNNNGNPE